VRVSLIFAIIVSFMLFSCVSSRFLCIISYFEEFLIHDSRGWIHDYFEEDLTESVGPVPFSAQYQTD